MSREGGSSEVKRSLLCIRPSVYVESTKRQAPGENPLRTDFAFPTLRILPLLPWLLWFCYNFVALSSR